MKLQIVPLDKIEFGDRRRKDYGIKDGERIEDLAADIQENGLICPIAVYSENGEPPYILAAGGRRYLAHLYLKEFSIACRIYDKPLTPLQLKVIELSENLKRKDLDYMEKCNLQRDIDGMQKEIYGEKSHTPGTDDADGWSLRDTASFMDRSPASVSQDIKLAEAHEAMPELGLDKCKTQKEATKKLKRLSQEVVRSDIAKRAERELKEQDKKFIDSYIIGDAFELIEKIPNESMNLVEVDPPFGIGIQSQKKFDYKESSHEAVYGDSYNEIAADYYPRFVFDLLKLCYNKMTNNSWLIFWFGPEPWFEMIYQAIIDTGFKTRRLTAHWQKPNGQTNQPQIYLASADEKFFYARKGDPVINKEGRSNEFRFDPVPPAQKIHETERPVPLMREILTTFCWEGSRILVPFAGSGNTLIAAREESMFPLGFDLTKKYKDAFVARYYGKASTV